MEPTGVISFSWPSGSYSRFNIKSYVNDLYYDSVSLYENTYNLSGLYEGDQAYLEVYGYLDNFIITPAHHSTNTYTVPIGNFGNLNSINIFNGFYFNEDFFLFNRSGDYYNSSVSYSNQNNSIYFNILNPRNNELITNLEDEALFSGLSYYFSNDSGVLFSGFSETNELTFNNSYSERLISGEFILHDVHQQTATGFIDFQNEAPLVYGYSYNFSNSSSGYVDLSIDINNSSTNISGYQYQFSDNSGHNNPFLTGLIEFPTGSVISYPTGQSGYLSLIPYDWNGSGVTFKSNAPLYYEENIESIPTEPLNSISEFNVAYDQQYIYLDYNFTNSNSIGSYGSLSIYSNPSYSGVPYYLDTITGSGSAEFDYFHNRTGDHLSFYLNLNLYSSGDNTLEDSAEKFLNLAFPRIESQSIDFNYENGYSVLSFSTYPEIENSNVIKLMYSGSGATGFDYYTGDSVIEYNKYASYEYKLVDFSGESLIYDSGIIQGEAVTPKIHLTFDVTTSPQDTIVYNLSNKSYSQNIMGINCRKKPVAVPLSGNFASGMYKNFDFNDYQDYPAQDIDLGSHLEYTNDSIKRNKNYYTTGDGYSGTYVSGQYYMYHFEPYNGFETGFSFSKLFYFASDPIIQKDVERQNLTEIHVEEIDNTIANDIVKIYDPQTIYGEKTFNADVYVSSGYDLIVYDKHGLQSDVATENLVNSQKVHTSRLALNYGVDNISIDYGDLNFTGSPYISPHVIAPFIDSSLIDAYIYDVPTSSGAKIKFSNPIDDTGYYLDLIFTDVLKEAISIQPSPSPSPTPSCTVTPTSSVTPTVTATPTSSVTPTVTPTSTLTPTVTPTSSITPTVTPTSTLTPTVTPTSSITPTVTPTISVTPTVTATPTSSVTPTVTPTPSNA